MPGPDSSMDLIVKYFPDFKDVGCFFKDYLKQYVTPESRILDIGCGRQAFGQEYYKIARWKVGVDPDREALENNRIVDEKIYSAVEDMPDFQNKFDVIIAQWVLEHVEDPEKVIKKIANNIKPGGYFLFMTTNMYSPLIWISKITPTFVKKYLKDKLLAIPENETYPTHYKINTPAKLDYYLQKHRFTKIEVKLVGVLTYFSVNKPILFAKAFFDRVLFDRFKFFERFNTHIAGVYRKM